MSLVFLAGIAAGVFVTFVVCFVMEMIIPHKTAQCTDVTSMVQENVKIDKQVAQYTTESVTSTHIEVVSTELSEVFTTKELYRGKNMLK